MSADHEPNNYSLVSDPQQYFRRERAHGSVTTLDGRPAVIGWKEVQDALRAPAVFSSAMSATFTGNPRPMIPVQVDPPDHARYRRLLRPPLAPDSIARLEPNARAIAAELIEALHARGECDLTTDFARPLVSGVFVSLFGIPSDDGAEVLDFVNDILRPDGSQDERHRIRSAATQRIHALLDRLIEERTHGDRHDLLSYLLRAEADGTRLSREEVLDICFQLLIAGMDTTIDAIAFSFAFLATHPDHRRELVDDPAIIPTAVEELLRWESPVAAVPRYLVNDTTVGGCPLTAQQPVNVVLASANTDEAREPDAFRIDLRRSPNRHFAFGTGIHRCAGMYLARMEMCVALDEWHQRIPDYTLRPKTRLHYGMGRFVRDIQHLPLVWTPK